MTNQASEELREMFKAFVDSGYHACYCPRSVDNGCECAIKDEYIDKVMAAIQSTIRTEKLKLLDEVRKRVVGEDVELNSFEIPVCEEEFVITSVTQQNRLRADQRISLTKLEAEL